MHSKLNLTLFLLLFSLGSALIGPTYLLAQEEDKGDLEDFGEDFGEDDSNDDADSGEAAQFFLYAFLDNIGDFVRLWGHTPETQFGPYPARPYADGDGFLSDGNSYRSYYFNTEFNYHNLGPDLRSYLFKWETQFAHRSKLSVDVSYYEEDVHDDVTGIRKDRLSFYGLRYGYAVYRTPQAILNMEVGYRGFHRHAEHGGIEAAADFLLFPRKPLIIETELAAAYVSHSPLFTVESSAGVLIGPFEFLAGLRLLKSENTILDGYRFGVRVWY